MATEVWRYIPLLKESGVLQMAIDRWLLEMHCRGSHPPTLRFYTWLRPTLSLGYHQRSYPPEWHTLTYQGRSLDMVRRPTGGRAVLHQGDLTYAIVRSHLPPNRSLAYQEICQFLISGWRSLGISLSFGAVKRGYIHNPNCFGTATGADLVTPDGAKLIGSAQLRKGDRVLQHGSMQLNPDPALFQQVFGTSLIPAQLPPALQHETGQALIIKSLKTAAEACFNIRLVEQPFTEQQWAEIHQLRSTLDPARAERSRNPIPEG